MGGSAWKVAYADFMTAMMAFFLLMWLLSVLTEEQKAGIAGMFTPQGAIRTSNIVPIGMANNPLLQYVDKLDLREFKMDEVETSFSISRVLRQFLMQNSLESTATGITSDNLGVLLHVSSDLMFEPGTVNFSAKGKAILNEVVDVSNKYKVYLIVRGHADASETGAPNYSSKWELSAARANSAVRYLISRGMNPAFIRSVSYADTRPAVPPGTPGALEANSRVEFNFHRQDTMSTIVGY